MGRNANWFRAVKKALGSDCKEHIDQRSTKAKKKWFVKKKNKKSSHPISKSSGTTAIDTTTTTTTTITPPLPLPLPLPPPPVAVEEIKQIPIIPCEEVKLKEEEEEEEDEQKRHAESIAIATAKAAEAAAAAAQAAAELVRLTNASPLFPGKPKEDVAALRIQTAFRAYLARRALCALRGLATLKIVMQGKCIKHTMTTTLKSMQSLARLQSQVCTRRLRMSEDNQGRMAHTLEKQQVKDLGKVERNANDSNAIPKSKEQAEVQPQSQPKATIRRDRGLAYSLNNHDQKSWRSSPTSNSKSAHTIFLDIKNQQHHSGWSWLERWLAARPWEKQASNEEEEDAKSVLSVQSDSDHDHDDYSTSPAAAHTHPLPSYMAPTQSSARAKKRPDNNKPEATGRLSVCSAKNAKSRHSTASETDAYNLVNVM